MEVDIDLSALEIQSHEIDTLNNTPTESPNTFLELESKDEADPVRRSGRIKIRPLENLEKRRVNTRPRRLNISSSIKEIESYYLDKKVKISSPALETIFEEPKKDVLMGTRKLKRSIHFSDMVSEKPDKNKVKKRSSKAKKINRFKKLGKKMGLELLMSKLKDLDSDIS